MYEFCIYKVDFQNFDPKYLFFIFLTLCTVRFVSETAGAKGFPDANAISAKRCLDLHGFQS